MRCARCRRDKSAAWHSPTTRTSASATSWSASTSRPLPAPSDRLSRPRRVRYPCSKEGVGQRSLPLFGPDPFMAQRRAHKISGPTQRQLRVGGLIRHALAEMLTRGLVHDEVLAAHVITIPEVRMSPDLRLATIYV